MNQGFLLKQLSRTGWPPQAVAEFTVLVQTVENLARLTEELARRINTLAIGHLVTETVLEHHKLWSPEVGEAIKSALHAKTQPAQEQEPDPDAQGLRDSQTEEPDAP